jgi:hypothetical protein
MIASMSDGSLGDVQPRISPGDKGFDWGIVMVKSFKSATDDWKQKSFIFFHIYMNNTFVSLVICLKNFQKKCIIVGIL